MDSLSTADSVQPVRGEGLRSVLLAAERLHAAVELDGVLEALLESAVELIAVTFAAIIVKSGDHSVCRYAYVDGAWQIEPVALPLTAAVAERAIEWRRPYRTGDRTAGEPDSDTAQPAGRHTSLLALPVLLHDGSVFCVLVLADRGDALPFSDDDERLMVDLARHAAIAVERAELTQNLQRAASALALLEERERIAMDLHDGVIQSLYGIMLQLQTEVRRREGSGDSRGALEQAGAQIGNVIQEIRTHIAGLWAHDLGDGGLSSALRSLADDVRLNAHITTTLDVAADLENLHSPEEAGGLLLIAREAASNVIRHANASTVTLCLTRSPDALVLVIRDDGRGLDPIAGARAGHGLLTMRRRAARLNGILTLTTKRNAGTEIRFEMPLRQVRDEHG